jgi:hypothetical protein
MQKGVALELEAPIALTMIGVALTSASNFNTVEIFNG